MVPSLWSTGNCYAALELLTGGEPLLFGLNILLQALLEVHVCVRVHLGVYVCVCVCVCVFVAQ